MIGFESLSQRPWNLIFDFLYFFLQCKEKNQILLDKINYSISDSNYYSTSISTSSSFLSASSLLSGFLQNRRLFQIDQISFSLENVFPALTCIIGNVIPCKLIIVVVACLSWIAAFI